MNFCSHCGASVELRIPAGDNLPRFVCSSCQVIHYSNPKIVVGCVPVWEDKVLLCKRAIEPRYGYWTLPAGFMENNESTGEAAMRETREEANANVELGELYSLYSLPHISRVYLMYRSRLIDLDFGPGPESLDVRLFAENEIPWDEIAFAVVKKTLENYFADRRLGQFPLHTGTIERVRHPDE